MKEIYLLVGDKLNTRTFVIYYVLEYLKDRAVHNRTVYVNSLDPNGIVWRLGKPWFQKVCFEKVCVARINYFEIS